MAKPLSYKLKRMRIEIREKEVLFFISYAIFLSYMILSTSFFLVYLNKLWKPVYIICILLLTLYEISENRLSIRCIPYIIVTCLIIVNIMITAKGIEQNAVACLILYCFCARNVSFRKIAKVTIIITGICLALVICSAYLGVITNYISIKGQRRREFLGFRYALFLPSLMSNISFLWIYLKKNKLRFLEVVLLFSLNLFIYLKCDGRLCFYQTVLMLVVAIIYKRWGDFFLKRKFLCWLMVASFLIAGVISIGMTIRYDPSVAWQFKMNSMLENRLSMGQQSLAQIGFGAFGIKDIQWVGAGLDMYGEVGEGAYFCVDCWYVQVLQRFGWLTVAVAVLFMMVATKKAYKNKDIYLLTIFCMIALHFVLDDLPMYLHYNTFWLAAGILVFPSHKRVVNEYLGNKERVNPVFGTP